MSARAEAILAWTVRTFGRVADHPHERAMRFLEEAMELAQSCGLSRETANAITERAYSRRAGEIDKELAQAGMTLEALAAHLGLDLSSAITNEFSRVREIPQEEWERRHAAKKRVGITADAAPPATEQKE
jgi:hypothetical protein